MRPCRAARKKQTKRQAGVKSSSWRPSQSRLSGRSSPNTGREYLFHGCWLFPSPLVGEGGAIDRREIAPDEGSASAERTPHPSSLREATLSHKGRGEKSVT